MKCFTHLKCLNHQKKKCRYLKICGCSIFLKRKNLNPAIKMKYPIKPNAKIVNRSHETNGPKPQTCRKPN